MTGVKSYDGSATVSASSIAAGNAVAGDTVTFNGSAVIASAAIGNQPITSSSALRVNNPNYTLTGASGTVTVTNADQVVSQVVNGTATFSSSGSTLTVNQTSPSATIDWLRFSIASGETVNFVQPTSASIALNRVVGNEQSVINGILTATGRVFLINSNGILFGSGSSVHVGAMLASALNISDSNFQAGNYVFTAANANGPVISNSNDFVAADGGFIAFASNKGVTNSAGLTAPGGKVLLVSADNLMLNPNTADNDLASYVITSLDGTTTMGGVVNVGRTIGNGGLIETAGAAVTLGNGYQIETGNNGTWSYSLPTITIGSTGNVSSTFVQNNLVLRNLSLNALGGDLTVSDPVTWSANTTLTLAAANNIYINNGITINGASAGLVMNYGGYNGINVTTPAAGTDYFIRTPASYAGAVLNSQGIPVAQTDTSGGVYGSITFTNSANTNGLTIVGQGYTLIDSLSQLATTGTLTGYYAIAQNMDATSWSTSNSGTGSVIANLSGTLAGLGHTISNLTISAPSTSYVGLVGNVSASATAVFRDLGIVNANVIGSADVGILLGFTGNNTTANPVTIKDVYTAGTVQGASAVGGFIGRGYHTNISNAYSSAAVTASGNYAGGFIGQATNATTVTSSDATGSVKGTGYVGGLIGYIGAGSGASINVNLSYAAGNITAGSGSYTGGLVGYLQYMPGSLANSFATGSVTSSGNYVGGLVGYGAGPTIFNCYATGNVKSSGNYVGGLAGYYQYGPITNSFATGNVSGNNDVGGLIGVAVTSMGITFIINNDYATGNVTGGNDVGGLVGAASPNYSTGSFIDITNSNTYGNVSGANYVGGILGANPTATTATFLINDNSYGNINGTGNYVGGIAGYAYSITGSTAYGAVTGGNYVGGIAGATYIVSNSYYAGDSVSGTAPCGQSGRERHDIGEQQP